MSHIFSICSALKELNLSNFNTNNVVNMNNMFYNCSTLTELDISNCKIRNFYDVSYMFSKCSDEFKEKIRVKYKKIKKKPLNN